MEIKKVILEMRLVVQEYDSEHGATELSREHARLEAAITRLALIGFTVSEADESDVCLEWDRPMTSAQAAKYHLTGGFVAVELYRATQRGVR